MKKLILPIIGSLIVLGFLSLHYYIEIKKHNLDVVAQFRLCVKDFDGDFVVVCAGTTKDQAILYNMGERMRHYIDKSQNDE